jgi:hypothetical protein
MYLVVYITPNRSLICRLYRFTLLRLYDRRHSSGWCVISIGKIYKRKVLSITDYNYKTSKVFKYNRFKNDLGVYLKSFYKFIAFYILPVINTLFILFFFNRK